MLRYENTIIGTMEIERDGEEYRLEIRQGNCLAVIIHPFEDQETGRFCHSLYSFFVDAQHIKNMMKSPTLKGRIFGTEKVVSIRLNLYFRESATLLKYFAKSGYEVTCYYDESTARVRDFNWQ